MEKWSYFAQKKTPHLIELLLYAEYRNCLECQIIEYVWKVLQWDCRLTAMVKCGFLFYEVY